MHIFIPDRKLNHKANQVASIGHYPTAGPDPGICGTNPAVRIRTSYDEQPRLDGRQATYIQRFVSPSSHISPDLVQTQNIHTLSHTFELPPHNKTV